MHKDRNIINDIQDWLFSRGLYPDVPDFKLKEEEKHIQSYEIEIMWFDLPGSFDYKWIGIIGRK